MKITRPFTGDFPVTNPFGVYDPIAYANYPGQKHSGVDYGLPMRTPIYAAMDGVTNVFDRDPSIKTGRGKEVVIVNGNRQKKECHLDEIVVGRNVDVKQGQLIGYSGNTGYSSGPHLHSEYLIDGQYVDQEQYITEEVPMPATGEETTRAFLMCKGKEPTEKEYVFYTTDPNGGIFLYRDLGVLDHLAEAQTTKFVPFDKELFIKEESKK